MPGGRWRLAMSAALVAAVIVPGSVAAKALVAAPTSDRASVVVPHDAPQSATIEIDPGARFNGYTNPDITIAQGGTLSVVNYDSTTHSVTSDDRDANGQPLFTVDVLPDGHPVAVPGVSTLPQGTYNFHCRFHPAMQGTLTIGKGGPPPPAQTFDQPLVRPKVLTTAKIRIPIKKAGVRVLPNGPLTQMWTYDGTYPGPTIVRPAGHDTKVTFVNHVSNTKFTVHFHGDHHKWTADGQPVRFLIPSGKAHTYDWPLTDGGRPERASFFWYHDHRMGATARNNWHGLQGMFIVTDGWTKKLGLPSGQYDVPLMVSERSFDANNQLTKVAAHMNVATTGPNAPPNDGTIGNDILVNGRYAPYLTVSTHRYRLRLLNTSPFTTYDFALSDGRPFVQIGTGNGLLPKAVVRQNILLGPAQRVDVVVDFSGEQGSNVVLESVPRPNRPKYGTGTPSAQIMQFRVRTSVTDNSDLPQTLEPAPKLTVPSKVSAVWSVGLGGNASTGTYWTLDGNPYAAKRVVLKVPLGSTQLWELRNNTKVTHFIHIHEEQWHTVLRDGKKPPPWERGLEDTWRLDPGERVRVAAKFTDYIGVFMIHCHMLDHEDDGLMAQWAVVDPRTKALPSGYRYDPKGGPAALARAMSPQLATLRTVSASALVSSLQSTANATASTATTGWMCAPPASTRRVRDRSVVRFEPLDR